MITIRISLSGCFLLLAIPLILAQNLVSISHQRYHQFEGDYYFEDGSYITGGLMDEGDGGLVFTEPWEVSKGGIFRPKNETTFYSITFSEAIPNGYTTVEFDLNEQGEVKGLWWKDKGEKVSYAEKHLHHRVKPVEFLNDSVTLAGELYLPTGTGPFPLIINVHGSGPQTRHLGPWNSLFPKYGIAVLSYDKRGAGASTGNFSRAGYPDFAGDVVAAIEFAKGLPEIRNEQIGLHGSSEGGWVASMATALTDEIAFLMVRVGSGVSGAETYMHEVKIELARKDLTEGELVQAIRFERKVLKMAEEKAALAAVNAYITEARKSNRWFEKAYGDYRSMDPDYWVKIQRSGHVDPVDYLRGVSDIPVLWFLAENDENVPYRLSKPRLEIALDEAGNDDFELITIPDSRHSFLTFTEKGKLIYAKGYWDKMLTWLKEHDITDQ